MDRAPRNLASADIDLKSSINLLLASRGRALPALVKTEVLRHVKAQVLAAALASGCSLSLTRLMFPRGVPGVRWPFSTSVAQPWRTHLGL